jgi:RNA polymerase sigma factor (sigma-70 family)
VEVSALKPPAATALRTPSALLRLQSDERLIALIRRGQHAAFEMLLMRYQSRLLAFCRHMLGSKEDAEDVLQEVFAAAFNAILADERPINVRPWLYRIARNRSLNHLRKASAIGVDSMDVHYAEGGLSTAEKAMRRESFRQLIGDVQQLPETQRTALLLREIDALSYEQIAEAMDTTVPAVKSLLVRARISLAEAAEARKLTCEEARLELGEAAEGLVKLSPPVRRHVRDCERCRAFRKQLKENNVALAAIMPVAPLLLVKKLMLSKLGGTAGAGGAHVAGAGGAGATATAAAGASAAGGVSAGGGLLTAGAGALATKAVAGLAVAAIVTAGTVAAERSSTRIHHRRASVAASAALGERSIEPVVTRSLSQPASIAAVPAATHTRRHRRATATAGKHKAPPQTPSTSVAAALPPQQTVDTQKTVHDAPTMLDKQQPPPPVTQVTTESTQLPSEPSPSGGGPADSSTEAGASTTNTTTTGGTEAASTPPSTTTSTTTTTPSPPPPTPPVAGPAGEPNGSDPAGAAVASDPAAGPAGDQEGEDPPPGG